ncbi:Tex family protein [Thaumasiovibrio sp. DFM-14]|uniref:Tex family protein n=1 Tax=Thaumasiovibrio sp. DFM-14 TaxID=3384792 RepID=UPI0039A2FE67
MSKTISQLIATELNVRQQQVDAAVNLLDDGNTVPFVARYRKEVTGGLDDTQLRTLESRLGYLRELDARRQVILKSIREQEKLTPQLEAAIQNADSKTSLEDLYLPYKPKRRTKGQIAIEAGLAPLAEGLWLDPSQSPEQAATRYVDPEKGIADSKAALDGARAILMERFAEDATLLEKIRRHLNSQAEIQARVVSGQEQAGAKFKDYFTHNERLSKVPSHRALAMFRGRNEGVLQLNLNADPTQDEGVKGSYCEVIIADHYRVTLADAPADSWRKQVISWAWRVKIALHMETELMGVLRDKAEEGAMQVFADNLKDLLMAAPAGPRCTLALDPGLRTGCKVAVVDATGKLLDTTTIYPHLPQKQYAQAAAAVAALINKHHVDLIAIGNGTASRETDAFVTQLLKEHELKVQSVMVSEAGASVYSASELAANEFPNLDVSLRGAVSIGRRLQDPLAELVKIDPKSIGVGQYQHDVSQSLLAKRLDTVVEDCVNAVGVDVNTASVPLLTRVAGLNSTIAKNIVAYRDEHGRFTSRSTLKKVARLGPKAFEQCAGFLRIMQGKNPLDSSAVHPESYAIVKAMAEQANKALDAIIGNKEFLRTITPAQFVTEQVGLPTINDIIAELDKPGRDPRPEFKTATFAEGIHQVKDLIPGMILEGVITNVTNFGAFVDVGVHQDGLVHISALSDKFISDPRDVVKAGDVVKVKVMEVDIARKRIGMSMRLSDEPGQTRPARETHSTTPNKPRQPRNEPRGGSTMGNAFGGAMADAFKKARK